MAVIGILACAVFWLLVHALEPHSHSGEGPYV